MISLTEASPKDLNLVRDLAYEIWPDAYGKILSRDQIDYMLEKLYSIEALQQNHSDGHKFYIINDSSGICGFTAIQHNWEYRNLTRIHKIYIRTNLQGKGIGKSALTEIEKFARAASDNGISLNVNRMNPARIFYEKSGFSVVATQDIDIGSGYLMEDFVMEKMFGL